MNALHAAGRDLCDPLLPPLSAHLGAGFPPTYLQSGTRDLHPSTTVQMHRALRCAGVPVECLVLEGRPRLGFGGSTPEDLETLEEQDRFPGPVLRLVPEDR